MRILIAATALAFTASVGMAGETTKSATAAPQVDAVVIVAPSGAEGETALSLSSSKAKSKSSYSGCHHARAAQAPLLMN